MAWVHRRAPHVNCRTWTRGEQRRSSTRVARCAVGCRVRRSARPSDGLTDRLRSTGGAPVTRGTGATRSAVSDRFSSFEQAVSDPVTSATRVGNPTALRHRWRVGRQVFGWVTVGPSASGRRGVCLCEWLLASNAVAVSIQMLSVAWVTAPNRSSACCLRRVAALVVLALGQVDSRLRRRLGSCRGRWCRGRWRRIPDSQQFGGLGADDSVHHKVVGRLKLPHRGVGRRAEVAVSNEVLASRGHLRQSGLEADHVLAAATQLHWATDHAVRRHRKVVHDRRGRDPPRSPFPTSIRRRRRR